MTVASALPAEGVQPTAQPPDFERLIVAGRLAEAQDLAFERIGDVCWHEEALTTLARCAAARRDYAAAVRWAERNHRLSPTNLSLACFLSALHLANGDAGAALDALSRFDTAELSAEAFIARAHAMANTGCIDEALGLAVEAATRYPAFLRDSLLVPLLDRVTALARAPGWIATDLGGQGGACLVGTLYPGEQPPDTPEPAVRLVVGNEILFDLSLDRFAERCGTRSAQPAGVGFSIPLPPNTIGERLVMTCDGRPLPGPPTIANALSVEGDATIVDGVLSGWAWLPAQPQERLSIRVSDEDGRVATVTADQPSGSLRAANIGDGCHGFTLTLSESDLRPGRLRVQAAADRLPVGDASLTGDPIPWIDPLAVIAEVHRIARAITGEAGKTPPPPLRAEPWAVAMFLRGIPVMVPAVPPHRQRQTPPRAARTDILIPVYRGREETLACIASVLDSVGADTEIIVIDDASPEVALSQALEKLAASGAITLLANQRNLGFPKTVNRGLALHPGRDVVLLNSDTLVSGDWLTRLRDAAYAEPDTGTVTPLSNDAEILSYPSGTAPRPTPDAAETAVLHTLAGRCNEAVRCEIPTAVGFCTFIRHDCLAETGPLDSELFGRGYGEENDFCLRARRLGWRHTAAADVFVAHVGGRSFGRRKALLGETNLRTVNRLHPGYDALVRRFYDKDPLADARRRLDMARWQDGADTRPARLIITFARTGGVAHFVDERIRRMTAQGRRIIVLRTADAGPGGERRCRIEDPERPDLRDLVFRTVAEYDLIVAFLAQVPVHTVEIQHYLDHDPSVLDLPSHLGLPFDVYVHDYCWICPQVVLIDSTNRYCGEPDLAACERCARTTPPATMDTVSVAGLRARSAAVLEKASAVILPSQDVAARIARHIPRAALTVRPWDEVRPAAPPLSRPNAERRRRVCLIGAIGIHKGYTILLDCARDAARRDLPLEFIVVGYTQNDAPLFETGRVFVTGPFLEPEITVLLRRQKADLAFFPSVCPETWSYALSHAWSAGLEAVAFNLGTIAERIRAAGGHLLPLGLSPDVINDRLLALMAGEPPPRPIHAPPCEKGSTTMLPIPATSLPAQAQINASAQLITFHPGLYSVSVVRGETAHDDGEADRRGDLQLPSIHLTPLPANAADVEMLGVVACGWLFHKGDAVVIKVSRGPAQVMLTSYQRTENGARSLGVQILRLNNAAAEAPPYARREPAVIRTQLIAHVQNNGDLTAPDGGWAGLPGQRLWIEGIAITPLDAPANSIEYKALAANGTETPWVSGGGLCGSRGMGVPLTGLAIRLKGAIAERFECQYEIAFLSGARSPVLTNGQPYRSDAIGDPIQAFTVRIVERAALPPPTFS